jgi:hypothetical protein
MVNDLWPRHLCYGGELRNGAPALLRGLLWTITSLNNLARISIHAGFLLATQDLTKADGKILSKRPRLITEQPKPCNLW